MLQMSVADKLVRIRSVCVYVSVGDSQQSTMDAAADADMVKSIGVQNFMRFHDRFFARMFLSGDSESDISNNFGILMAT